jgi:aspartate oxidase
LHPVAASYHPLRLVEDFNRLNLILRAILVDEVKERDESVVEVGVRFPRILHHPKTVVEVDALETEHGQHDLEALVFCDGEHGFDITEELVGKTFEVSILIVETKLLARIIMNPDSHGVDPSCLYREKASLKTFQSKETPKSLPHCSRAC